MSSNLITNPNIIMLDPTGGGGRVKPIANGKFYYGEIDKDPLTNPIQVYFKDETGQEVAINQPLTTNNSGAFIYNQSLINPYTRFLGYSTLALDKNDVTIYRDLNVGDEGSIASITNLVYKASGGNSAVDNMISGVPVAAKEGDLCSTGGAIWERISTSGGDINDFRVIGDINVYDVGAVSDGSDQTQVIVDYVGTLPSDFTATVKIPSGVKYQINPVMAAAPAGAVIVDEAGLHTQFGGYKPQFRGTYQRGTSGGENDVTQFVHTGHNTSFMYSNDGSSGSSSGDLRAMQTIYAFGFDETSFPRVAGKIEFQDFNDDKWAWGLRALAPFVSRDYFNWAQGESVSIGDSCKSGANFYLATTAGTTGSNAPVHTSGTASDGGVTWEYVEFLSDRTIWKVNEIGQVFLGGYKPNVDVLYQQHPSSPNTVFTFNYSSIGDGKALLFSFDGKDSGGVDIQVPNVRCDFNGYRWTRKSDGTELAKLNENGFNLTHRIIKRSLTISDNDSTPSVDGISSLILANTAATTITTLDDGVTDQEVQLIALNGNTTLQHGGAFQLTGSSNIALSQFSVVTMRRISGSGAWIEVSRSIK